MISNSGTSTLGLYDLKRQIDTFGGVDYFRPNLAGGYLKNARVMLSNGDIVKSTIDGNVNNPNDDMVGWVRVGNVYQVDTVEELLNIQSPKGGDICNVSDDLRGGKFEYFPSRSTENNGGTVFNGWVRKYFGSVYLEWFCETDPKSTDCSSCLERAFSVTRGVKAGAREFKFTERVGLPDQTNVARQKITLKGDGDTVFDMSEYNQQYACFTSAAAKANPTSTENLFTAIISIKDINFVGDENRTCHLIDGDRFYNIFFKDNNVKQLKSLVKSFVSRPPAERGVPYTQTLTIKDNHISMMDSIIDAYELININFCDNQCEANSNGIYCRSTNAAVSAMMVGRFNNNLFEGGGQFLHIEGSVKSLTLIGNYFEANNYGRVETELCQINITGQCYGFLEAGNSFLDTASGLINAGYIDIRTDNTGFMGGTNQAKPVSIASASNAAQHTSTGKFIEIGMVALSTTPESEGGKNTTQQFKDRNLRSAQESGISALSERFSYSIDATVKNANNQLLVAVLDLTQMLPIFKNKMSMCSYNVSMNLDLENSGVSVGMATIDLKLGIFAPTMGLSDASLPSELHVVAKLENIIQAGGWVMDSTMPSALLRKQFGDSVSVIVEPISSTKVGLRLSDYLQAAGEAYGYPNFITNSIVSVSNNINRDYENNVGVNLRFIKP